jgi:hypothetical protein
MPKEVWRVAFSMALALGLPTPPPRSDGSPRCTGRCLKFPKLRKPFAALGLSLQRLTPPSLHC